MADLTSSANISVKKVRRGAHQGDTIGAVFTRSYGWTLPAAAASGDTFAYGVAPQGCLLIGVAHKANTTANANCAIQHAITANSNGAGGNIAVANVANNLNTAAWCYATSSVPANAVTASNSTQYLAGQIVTASGANACTMVTTFFFMGVDPETAPYSTFTI